MENAPTSVNAAEKLKFKLLCQLQVTPPGASFACSTPTRLVATSSKYGLIFVGDAQGFQCIQTNSLIESVHGRPKSLEKIKTYPRREIPLGCAPTHLDVSGDGEILAVTSTIQGCPFLIFYRIASFGTPNADKSCQVRLSSTENVWVVDLQWNPGIANMIGAVTSDGAAIVCEITQNGPVINSIPPNSQSLCLCWSPKGKRVVIGSKGGSIMQYMPELKVVKAIPTPSFPQKNMNIISIRWLSNTQFIAVYKDSQDQSGSSSVIVINAPQNKEPQFINYDDMFCGGLTERSEHYFIHIPQWNMVILGNGNALESAVLCQENDLWVQWSIDDGFRAELPLSDNHADVYNIGMAVDFSSQFRVPLDENMTLEPRPLLLMYSHIGVLCLFHSLNFIPGAPELCIKPQNLPRNFFTEKQPEAAPAPAPQQVAQAPVAAPTTFQFSMPSFGPPTTSSAGQPLAFPMQQPGQMAFPTGQTFNFSTASQLSQFTTPPKTVQTPPQVSLSSFQQVQPQPKVELPKTVEFVKPPTTQATSGLDLGSLLGQNKDFGIQQSFGLRQTQVTGTPQKPLLSKPEVPVSAVPSQPSTPPTAKETPKEDKPSAEAIEKARKEKEKALIDAMIKEFKVVDAEFKDYKKKISNFDLMIGDDSFLSTIPSKVADFEMFEKDLSETTGTQSAEVNILRCNLVELYGYVENIKARDRHIKSQRYLECLESQSLDPITKRHIKNIEQQMHFVDSQIKQATAHLDAIWTSHKNSKAKDTLDIPNMESIYQVMVSQSHILSVQKNVVNDQYNKLRQHLKRVKKIPQVIEYSSPSYNAKTGESNLDILADKLLHTTLDSKSPSMSFKETSCRYIVLANAKKNLSPSKEKSLGSWHKSHKLITTKPVKPFGNEDDDFLQTPSPASVIEKTPEAMKSQKNESFHKSFSSPPQSSVLVKEINKSITPQTPKSADKIEKFPIMYEEVSSSTPVKPTHSISVSPLSTPFSGTSFSSSWSPATPLTTKPFAQLSFPSDVAKTTKPETTSIFSGSSFPSFCFATAATKTAVTTSSSTLNTLVQKESSPKLAEVKEVETTPLKATTAASLFGSSTFTSPATSMFKNVSSESTGTTSIFGGTSTASTTPSLFSGVSSLSFSSLAVSTTTPATTMPSKVVTTTVAVTTSATSVFNLSSLSGGQTSIFSAVTTSGSIFGNLPSGTTVFSSTPSTGFGSTPSIFGGQTTTVTSSTSPITTASETVSATSSVPIFGGTGTPLSAFGGSPITAAALSVVTTASLGTTSVATSTVSGTSATATTASLFGGTPATATTASVFGGAPSTATTTSVFGGTPATTSVFGGTPATAALGGTAATAVLGGTASTASLGGTAATAALGGTPATAALGGTPATAVLGGTPATAALGGTPATAALGGTTATAVLGGTQATTVFGGTPATTTTSVFGGAAATTASVFGGTPATTASVFGTAPTVTSSAPLFGTTAPTTNVFGAATTTSMFGGTASTFGSTPATTSSVFGSTTSSSVFGTSSFGTTATTTASVFGGTAATSVFGGTATTFASPTTTSSVFGATNALSSTSFFGSPTTGSTFQTPTFGASPQQFSNSPFFQTTTPTTNVQQNVFASTSFTQATTASSIFGGSPTFSQSTGNIFGNAATPNKFNTSSGSLFGGSFSTPTQPQGFSSGQTGGLFGSNSSFQNSPQTPSGFGSPPAFGSAGSSIFGGSQTSFGAAPTFGGSATFGSPKKVFGEATAAPSFGTPTQQSPTFENLAGQNTLTFGNLAQNQGTFGSSFGTPPQTQQPAFPSSTFGGSSFSSWR